MHRKFRRKLAAAALLRRAKDKKRRDDQTKAEHSEMATKRDGDPKAIREVGADDDEQSGEEGDWSFSTMFSVTKDQQVQPNRNPARPAP